MAGTESTPTSHEGGARIEVRHLTKRFGQFTAVDDLSFEVEPGRITGFLGPNGAGKTTTLRMLLDLVHATSGTATIDGRRYRDLPDPMGTVGSALEATNFHPGRSGRDHLRVLAAAARIPERRVDELLELTGIPAAARKRAGEYSMGMRQRLGLAAALLGDPRVLILDEPSNGLDPEGIRWLREFLRALSEEGKTILVSSHLLQEVEQTADEVVIIANGRLVRAGSVAELGGGATAVVRTSDPDRLAGALRVADVLSRPGEDGTLLAETTDLRLVGDVALRAGLPVWELREHRPDLESLFFELTEGTNRNLGEAAQRGAPPATLPAVPAVPSVAPATVPPAPSPPTPPAAPAERDAVPGPEGGDR
jgi:ABC-2 type transport system ATP-binding protein